MSKSIIDRVNRNIMEHKQTINKPIHKIKYRLSPISDTIENAIDIPKKLELFKSRDTARDVKMRRVCRMINEEPDMYEYKEDIYHKYFTYELNEKKPLIHKMEKRNMINVIKEIPTEEPIIKKPRAKKLNMKRKHTAVMKELLSVLAICSELVQKTEIETATLVQLAIDNAKDNKTSSGRQGILGYILSYFY